MKVENSEALARPSDPKSASFAAFEAFPHPALVIDADRRIRAWNRAFRRWTGRGDEEVRGRSPADVGLAHGCPQGSAPWEANRDHWEGEGTFRRSDGTRSEGWLTVDRLPESDAGEDGLRLVVFTDQSGQRAALEQLRQLAMVDALTGLPNRLLFLDRLETALARCRRDHGRCAVLFVDLDGFKTVNDRLGHAAGDALLRRVARELRDVVRESDTVGRLGGDEFGILLPDIRGAREPEVVARKVVECVRRPKAGLPSNVRVGASVGIALFPTDACGARGLIAAADSAMYRAKDRAERVVFAGPE